jgi:L-ascorbate metabolism protein UlaG (beta-lactamase superfamily)
MRIVKKLLLSLAIILVALTALIYIFMQQNTFGKNPSGERLERIKKSPHYKDGSFHNLTPTEVTLKSASFIKLMSNFLNKPKTTAPPKPIPSIKTDLKNLQADKPVIIWFGHSSYFIKSKDVTILVDPVLSGNASPVSFFGKSFQGTDIYNVGDFPPLDMVIITHDHYDHLDYKTITGLAAKTHTFYTSLGVGAHLEHWGIAPEKIIEFDWWEHKKINEQIEITATPARHFSGRSFQRNKTLWSSFVLKLHGYTIMIGGDSGYENHFKTIGEKYGPFDLAILEAGQYGADWPFIHMMPEETVKAAIDLQAKVLFPVHWSKFALAYHAWNEPIQRVVKSAAEQYVQVTTPQIGEPIIVDSLYTQKAWWNF